MCFSDKRFNKLRVLVAQLGSRRYYGVPRVLYRSGKLASLHTDLYLGKWPWKAFAHPLLLPNLPRVIRAPFGRRTDIPSDKIKAFQKLRFEYSWRKKRSKSSEKWRVDLWAGDKFNRLSIKTGLGDVNCVYGFKSGSFRLFEYAKAKGIKCVLDYMGSSTIIEHELVGEEYSRWLGWEEPPSQDKIRAFGEREAMESELADFILCPTEFVRKGLLKVGVESEKCRTVPYYGVNITDSVLQKRRPSKPIKVLFVGRVRLLKGIPYLLDAIRQFSSNEVVCRVVGPINVSIEKIQAYVPPNVRLLGSVPRAEVKRHYEWADILCLPSLCEGSALVIYEALTHGLAIVTTANSGSIIESSDSSRNVIVPIKDADAIAEAIRTIAVNWRPAEESEEAMNLAQTASFESYSVRLNAALEELISDV